jgi:hypothetical protein
LGDVTQGPIDLKAAAEKLGVSEASLQEALGIPAGGPPQGGLPPDNGSVPSNQGQ